MEPRTSCILEFYDPSTDIWTSTSSTPFQRISHTATVPLNGKVLVTVGHDDRQNPLDEWCHNFITPNIHL